MTRALGFLLWLRCRAWLRRIGRNAGSVTGVLTLAFGVLFVAAVLGPNLFVRLMPGVDALLPPLVEPTRRYGPLVLFGYCLAALLFASGEQALPFTPAEVQFLFAGPFGRRQVLAYKLTGNALLCVVYGLFLTGFLLPHTARPTTAFPGLVLMLWFIMLFSTAVSLCVQAIGIRADSRPRKLLLAALAVLALGWLTFAGGGLMSGGPEAVVGRLEASPVAVALLAPLRWFVETFTAERVWPDFAAGAARCLAVDGALLALIFLLDAQYLEGAAAASERTYERLQRIRSGGAFNAGAWTAARPRLTLPSFPWLGGAGPVAWRQMLSAIRNIRPVLIFLGLFALISVAARLAFDANAAQPPTPPGMPLAVGELSMSLAVLTTVLTYDFRGDVDRMDVLKSLPVSPAALAVGQLATPVLFLSGIQLALVGLVQVLLGGVEPLLGAVALYGVPFNFLSLAVENVLFLWFPARLVPGAPGDFQQMGRNALMMFAKFALVGLAVGPAAAAGVVGYALARALGVDGTVPALAASWVVLTGLAACLVPLLVRAFHSFDVARDTPP